MTSLQSKPLRHGLLAAAAATGIALAGCGSASLSAASSCQEFVDAPPAAQDAAVLKVAQELNAPAAMTMLGRPSVNSFCDGAPARTLGEAITAVNGGPITDSGAAVTSDEAPSDTPEATEMSESEPIELNRVYRWDAHAGDETTASLELTLGNVQRSTDPAALGEFAQYLDVCDVDPERDAVMPIRLRLTNTTDGFSVKFEARVVTGSNSKTTLLAGATTFSAGPVCNDQPSQAALVGADFGAIEPQATSSHDWLIVIKGYYSPKHRNGKAKEIAAHRPQLMVITPDGRLETECDPKGYPNFGLDFLLFDAPAEKRGKTYDTTC